MSEPGAVATGSYSQLIFDDPVATPTSRGSNTWSMILDQLNRLSPEQAEAELLKCCGSKRWARAMSEARPFADFEQLAAEADRIWRSLNEADWLEAFRAHPKIGEKKAATAQSHQAHNWSAREQSGVAAASAERIAQLSQLNREYDDRFGFIFIVCASGKSSADILKTLKARLLNEPADELCIAAEEQRKITRLRLEKLLDTA